MKKHLHNNAIWLSFLSAVALIFVFLIGTGTDFGVEQYTDFEQDSKYLGNGEFQRRTESPSTGAVNVWTGTKDVQGRWDGPVTIEEGRKNPDNPELEDCSTEKVTYVEGRRNGMSIIDYKDEDKPDSITCYTMGRRIPCQISKTIQADTPSASQLLFYNYPWYVNSLNVRGFENEFIRAYVDTLETILLAMEDTGETFLDYYGYALDSLEGTVYDTIMISNESLTMFYGQEELLNGQFRLAVVDHSRQEGSSTFDIIKTKYPGYLENMNLADISDQDFEIFCGEVDSLMNSYTPPLDMEDPFFTDSVDSRIYAAVMYIGSYEDSTETTEALKSASAYKKSTALRNSLQTLRANSKISPTSPEVAFIVFYTFIEHLFLGDKISLILEESYNDHHSIISIPTVTTEYLGSESATGANLNGYIHDDGGAAVTASGIAWSTHYNPTIGDNSENSSTTSGSFIIALDGLTEGSTYFARTFATNSSGTAYGNCVEFVAGSTIGIETAEFDHKFNIYPNPASDIVTFRFMAESLDPLELSIINLKGQVVYHHEIAGLSPGDHQIELDLSDLNVGIYNCQLSARGSVNATRKLVILH